MPDTYNDINTTTINTLDFVSSDLAEKLRRVQNYVLKKYKYYDDENYYGLAKCDAVQKTIDEIKNKMVIDHIKGDKKITDLFSNSALSKVIKSALITGCGFFLVKKNMDDTVSLVPYDSYYATGTINNDNYLTTAITVDLISSDNSPLIVSNYEGGYITQRNIKTGEVLELDYGTEVAPIIPIIINANALKPFGKSAITKEMEARVREYKTLKKQIKNQNEIYATSQDILLGASKDIKKDVQNITDDQLFDKLKNILVITKDADGDAPSFARQNSDPSKLTAQRDALYNSIIYNLDSKAGADMVASIREDINEGVNNVANYIRTLEGRSKTKIKVIYKNNYFANAEEIGDDIIKINQVIPDYIKKDQADEIIGMDGSEKSFDDRLAEAVEVAAIADIVSPEAVAKNESVEIREDVSA